MFDTPVFQRTPRWCWAGAGSCSLAPPPTPTGAASRTPGRENGAFKERRATSSPADPHLRTLTCRFLNFSNPPAHTLIANPPGSRWSETIRVHLVEHPSEVGSWEWPASVPGPGSGDRGGGGGIFQKAPRTDMKTELTQFPLPPWSTARGEGGQRVYVQDWAE